MGCWETRWDLDQGGGGVLGVEWRRTTNRRADFLCTDCSWRGMGWREEWAAGGSFILNTALDIPLATIAGVGTWLNGIVICSSSISLDRLLDLIRIAFIAKQILMQ